jgi:hypothetical protein
MCRRISIVRLIEAGFNVRGVLRPAIRGLSQIGDEVLDIAVRISARARSPRYSMIVLSR